MAFTPPFGAYYATTGAPLFTDAGALGDPATNYTYVVSAMQANQSAPVELGQIQLATFANPAGLENQGRSLMLPTHASGQAVVGTPGTLGLGTLSQGFLEMSNVKVVEEMVDMISAQRAYEINSKSIQAADEMLQMANNLRR